MGLEPMTGRGVGYCAGFGVPGYMNNVGGRGFGMDFGRGACFGGRGGRGGGFGFRNRFHQRIAQSLETFGGIFAAPYQSYDPETEKQFLNNQTEILQKEIDAIKKRLDDLNAKTQKK
jgi:hypothetical protein